jgi:hypothetical protein
MVIRQPHDDHPESGDGDRAGPCGDVAAYALGVLDPDQHVTFSRHLAGCESCRRDAADFGAFTPALRPALGDGVRPPCRITRDILVVAAGVVVAVAAVLSVVESLSSHVDDPAERGALTHAQSAHAEPFPLLRSI